MGMVSQSGSISTGMKTMAYPERIESYLTLRKWNWWRQLGSIKACPLWSPRASYFVCEEWERGKRFAFDLMLVPEFNYLQCITEQNSEYFKDYRTSCLGVDAGEISATEVTYTRIAALVPQEARTCFCTFLLTSDHKSLCPPKSVSDPYRA